MSEEDFRVHFPENRSFFSFYTLKKVLKLLFALMIVALFATVVFRSISMKGSKEMQSYLWTAQAMDAAGKDGFQIYEVSAIPQPSVNATFAVSHIYYTEPIGQLQFLISYNLSKLEEWATKLELAQVPKDGENLFAFVLTDSEGNRYTDYEYKTDTLFFNGFFRLVFSDVDLMTSTVIGTSEPESGENPQTEVFTAKIPIESFKLCVYYKGDVNFDGEKIDEMTVYQYGSYMQAVSPSAPSAPSEGMQHVSVITVTESSVTAEPTTLAEPQATAEPTTSIEPSATAKPQESEQTLPVQTGEQTEVDVPAQGAEPEANETDPGEE